MDVETKITGDKARLFPVLADSKKEGRALSIFLFNLCTVHECSQSLLGTIGVRIGSRSKITAFTEVTFPKDKESVGDQPDGLLIVRNGRRIWSAIIEAKIGTNRIDPSQIERYLKVARRNGVDAVISISNEFAITPNHPPFKIKSNLTKSVKLFHWSWKNILTHSSILTENQTIEDSAQAIILTEFVRFLRHDSTGIQGINRMGKNWSPLVSKFLQGAKPSPRDDDVQDASSRWLQEARDLELILSRRTGTHVTIKQTRAHAKDATKRFHDTCVTLANEGCLCAEFDIPDAASLLTVKADLKMRSIRVSMKVVAPQDRKYPKSCVIWLLKQLKNLPDENLHIRANWPGRIADTQKPYSQVLEDPTCLVPDNVKALPKQFRVIQVADSGSKFRQSKNFIFLLEDLGSGLIKSTI